MKAIHFDECMVCHRESNPLYMCDRDAGNNTDHTNLYCGDCFEKVGCLDSHPEDCATMIVDDGRTGPKGAKEGGGENVPRS
jgi:hypothetical protein